MKKSSIYTEKVLAYFKNPRNMGNIKKPDGVGKVGNIVCGDVMHLYIKVGKNKEGEEIIKDVKFETLGCVAAIATSSAITELVKGKTFKEALKLKKEDIVKKLGGLPPVKIHCSVLAIDALYEAIYDYFRKKKKEISEALKKTHEKIQKDKKFVEKRYKKWLRIEKAVKKNEK